MARLSKKLDDKMLGSFPIVEPVGYFYKLQLALTIKIYNIFYPSLLRKDP